MPPFRRPSNWDSLSSVDKAAYSRKLRATDDKMSRLLEKLQPSMTGPALEANKASITKAWNGLTELERERAEAIMREHNASGGGRYQAPGGGGGGEAERARLTAIRADVASNMRAAR